MEVQNVLSELHALKELYGLLQNNRDHELTVSYKLDEEAHILLKKLLDDAKERVLVVCSKITAAQSSRRNSRWPSLLEALEKVHPHNLQYCQDASSGKKNHEKDSNQHTSNSSQPKWASTRSTSLKDGLELSEFSVSRKMSQNEMEQCRICQKCGRKQKLATDKVILGSNISPTNQGKMLNNSVHGNVEKLEENEKVIVTGEGIEKPRKISIYDFPFNSRASSSGMPTARIAEPHGSTDCIRMNDKFDEQSDFLADIAYSINGIEFCISSLQLCSDSVEDVKHQVAPGGLSGLSNPAGPVEQIQEGLVTESESSEVGDTVLNRNRELFGSTIRRTWKHGGSCNLKPDIDLSHQTNRTKERHNIEDCSSIMKISDSPSQQTKKNIMHRRSAELTVRGSGLPTQRTTHACHQNMNNILQNIMPLNELESQTDSWSQSDDIVYGSPVPFRKDDMGRKARAPVEAPMQVIEQIARESRFSEGREKAGKPSTSFLPRAADPGRSTKIKKPTSREKNLKRQVILRPTLLDYMSSDSTLGPSSHNYQTDYRRSGIQRKGTMLSHGKILKYEQGSDELEPSSSCSSSWATQQTSPSISESETYSSSSQPSGSQSETSSYASPASSRFVCSSSDYSSEDSDFLSNTESNHGSIKHSNGRTSRRYRSGHRPAAARLKRLKDKLALIFHHHHHHHHHHYSNDNEDKKNNIVNIHRKTSRWKQARDIFGNKNNAKNSRKGAAESMSRSVVKKVNHTDHQVGQFHGLVRGLMKHTRHSKKPNHSKVDARKLGNRHHVQNKGAKLHLWNMIRHNRTKLPKRGQVKIGMPKKQRLITN